MSSKSTKDTSLTLLERVQRFPVESEAWDEFVRRYHPLIRAWCMRWGLQASDADDVVQDVLVKLLTAMRKFQYDPAGSFSAWLKSVTRHALSDFSTDKRKEPCQIAPSLSIADLGAAQVDLARELQTLLDRDLIEIALRMVQQRVKPVTWEAFRLFALENLSGKVVAERLQIPVAHVFVAKNRVQKLIQEEVRMMKGDGT